MEFNNLTSFQNLNNTDVPAEWRKLLDGIYVAEFIPTLYSIVTWRDVWRAILIFICIVVLIYVIDRT